MKEEWKRIKEYKGYSVSNSGKVRNNRTDKILKPTENNRGYLTVKPYRKINRITLNVHRLVAENFVKGKTKKKCQVNHKNEKKD